MLGSKDRAAEFVAGVRGGKEVGYGIQQGQYALVPEGGAAEHGMRLRLFGKKGQLLAQETLFKVFAV